jgi:hypothetical protein
VRNAIAPLAGSLAIFVAMQKRGAGAPRSTFLPVIPGRIVDANPDVQIAHRRISRFPDAQLRI